VLAFPGETVDRVQRNMMLKSVENVVVVKSNRDLRPVGIVRANDILQLRRWLVVEETGELRRESLDKPEESPGVKLG
jgi:chloride channel protein, CIC family